ncbi:protease [cyanobacterium endosymbiont of Rhopalodia gibberula]|uniref:HhoA/HhoB/HtrA family serine endopeptidase n=1 Tax=cyanobacterium endosymbiont of Rhopalodia gibberula TaxID=1763363 RepID=UPI000DC73F43|nr:HhoA/HhoB/HtrA family serine endopeptidase [cyanobacterium endosymbiont of Rhopalodia gibberula]BBA78798.1 protease [cyanobacterium endosymbiont of Rhopalodia gibberula]
MKNNTLNPDYSHSNKSQRPILRISLTYVSLVLLGIGIGAGGAYTIGQSKFSAKTSNSSEKSQITQSSERFLPSQNNGSFVTDVVKKVGPAVVRIDASRTVINRVPPIFDDPFLRRFFSSEIPGVPQEQIERGTGSGFILSKDGKILTNAHVVAGTKEVTVTLKDGRTFEGKVLGTDPLTDVAVIKIEANDLPKVQQGNSDDLLVGEWAIAIGNPLGLDNTVTTGIISATKRLSSQVGVGDKRIEFIQTDAAINPGNSGGPLLNSDGQVIGMNTAIIQNAQGIGFAIPINKAERIANKLIKDGKVEHPFLGIQMVEITPEIKKKLQESQELDLTTDQGVLIAKVMPDSPAEQAGLKTGDILQGIGEKRLNNPGEVQKAVEETQVGEILNLQIERDGSPINLSVKVGVLPTN